MHYVEGLLKQPMSLNSNSQGNVHKITCYPSPPNEELLSSRLTNLSQTLEFLSTHLFSQLPASQQTALPQSLCKSITSHLLNTLLIPSLPNTFSDLSSYLVLTREAVAFEKKYSVDLLGNDSHDQQVKQWVGGVGGHYERRRRTSILDEARKVALQPDNLSEIFTAEVDLPLEAESPAVIPVQSHVEDVQPRSDDDAWGFDSSDSQEDKGEADGWGFDDDVEDETDVTSSPEVQHIKNAVNGDDAETEPDPGDAWGWNDEDEPTPDSGEATDESAWDDPWGDSSTPSEPADARPPPAPSIKVAKTATRLEKLANKGKKVVSAGSTSSSSPEMVHASTNNSPRLPPAPTVSITSPPVNSATKRPSKLSLTLPKETYVVSSRMREVLTMVNDVLREGQEFAKSRLTTTEDPASSQPGSTLSRTAVSVLDLYRALYPAVFSAQLESIEGPIRYSNNCLYLSKEVERIGASSGVKELENCASTLKVLGDSWYADAIVCCFPIVWLFCL